MGISIFGIVVLTKSKGLREQCSLMLIILQSAIGFLALRSGGVAPREISQDLVDLSHVGSPFPFGANSVLAHGIHTGI